jgi:hypothetical protein
VKILSRDSGPKPLRGKPIIDCFVALSIAVTLANAVAVLSGDPPADEYQVKAAFIYNFAKFIQWPPESFQSPSQPIGICILGQDPFGRSLDDTVVGHSIDGRALVIHRIVRVKPGNECQILFVGSAQGTRPLPIPEDTGLLTIGESDAAAMEGVIITFRLDGGKVKFDIDVDEANREKLRISSRLLSLAHIVGTNRK